MTRILFIDDDPAALRQIEAQVRPLAPTDWELFFCQGSAAGWAMTSRTIFDAVVADWNLGGLSGSELLFKIMHRHPQTVRIALSDRAERTTLLRSLGPAHQHLAKPVQASALKETLARALLLRGLLANEQLEKLVSHVLSLPSIPDLYLELLEELRSEEPSIHRLGQIISRDLGMLSKLLQFANSAYFGHALELSDPEEAVAFLGIETVKGLVLSLQIFSLYERAQFNEFSFVKLWEHSWQTALWARKLAELEGLGRDETNESFVAGLLHDVGKLLLATGLPSQFQESLSIAARESLPMWQVEQGQFGCTHAEVGAYLLALWGSSPHIVQAVCFHHYPGKSGLSSFGALAAVHCADFLSHQDNPPGQRQVRLDTEFLAALGLQDRLAFWKDQLAGGSGPQATGR